MSGETAGRVAMITGANRGIGRVIALEMGRAGYRLALNWFEEPARTEALSDELTALGYDFHFEQGDVSVAADVDRMIAPFVTRFGRLDVLVNNAATLREAPALELAEADLDRVLAVNLKGAFLCAQRAARVMAGQGWGRIINISSVHQFVPKRHSLPYNLAKAGLGMLTKSLALELGPLGIVCVGVAPGGVEATMKDREPTTLIQATPVRAIAQPEEIAAAVIFLASDQARFANGATLLMDGGLTLGPYTRDDF